MTKILNKSYKFGFKIENTRIAESSESACTKVIQGRWFDMEARVTGMENASFGRFNECEGVARMFPNLSKLSSVKKIKV